jgi:hypothetical protein
MFASAEISASSRSSSPVPLIGVFFTARISRARADCQRRQHRFSERAGRMTVFQRDQSAGCIRGVAVSQWRSA